ncbi:hypothetical protein ABPG73_009167 [Tetrahymena malaccensis]
MDDNQRESNQTLEGFIPYNQNLYNSIKIMISQLPQVSVIDDAKSREQLIKEVMDSIQQSICSNNQVDMTSILKQRLNIIDKEAAEIATQLQKYILKDQVIQSESITNICFQDQSIKNKETNYANENFSERQNNLQQQQKITGIKKLEDQSQDAFQLDDQQLEESKTSDSKNLFVQDYGQIDKLTLQVKKENQYDNKNLDALVDIPEIELKDEQKDHLQIKQVINYHNQIEFSQNYEIIHTNQQTIKENPANIVVELANEQVQETNIKDVDQELPLQDTIQTDQLDVNIHSKNQNNDILSFQQSEELKSNSQNNQETAQFSQSDESLVSKTCEHKETYQITKNDRDIQEDLPEITDKNFSLQEQQKESQTNEINLEFEQKPSFLSLQNPLCLKSAVSMETFRMFSQQTKSKIQKMIYPTAEFSQPTDTSVSQEHPEHQETNKQSQIDNFINQISNSEDNFSSQQLQTFQQLDGQINNELSHLATIEFSQPIKSSVSQENFEHKEACQQSKNEINRDAQENLDENRDQNLSIEEKLNEQQNIEIGLNLEQKIQLNDESKQPENTNTQTILLTNQIPDSEDNLSKLQIEAIQQSNELKNNFDQNHLATVDFSEPAKSSVSQDHSEYKEINENTRVIQGDLPQITNQNFSVEENQKEQQQNDINLDLQQKVQLTNADASKQSENKNTQSIILTNQTTNSEGNLSKQQLELFQQSEESKNNDSNHIVTAQLTQPIESSVSQQCQAHNEIYQKSQNENITGIQEAPTELTDQNYSVDEIQKEKQKNQINLDPKLKDQLHDTSQQFENTNTQDINLTNQINNSENDLSKQQLDTLQQQNGLNNNEQSHLETEELSKPNKSSFSQEQDQHKEISQLPQSGSIREIQVDLTDFRNQNFSVEEKQKESIKNQINLDLGQKEQLNDGFKQSENTNSQDIALNSQISNSESNLFQQQFEEQQKQIKEEAIRKMEVELQDFLSDLIESMPETKVLHQKRPLLKTQLLEGLQAQYKNNSLCLDSLKKNIKFTETEKFNQEIQKNFLKYQKEISQKIQDFQEKKQEQSQQKYIKTKIFLNEYFKNEEIEQFYIQMIEQEDINIQIEDLPCILIRDKDSFLNKLETKYKDEYKQLYDNYLAKTNKILHPFYLLLQRNYLKSELMMILESKSDILREEKGIYEIPKIFYKIENLNSIKNAISEESDELLEGLYLGFDINEEHLDSYDFIELIRNLFQDSLFQNWLSLYIQNLTQINQKIEEEMYRLSYIDQYTIDQTFYEIIKRLQGEDPNLIPDHFMQCMYTLSSDYIKNQLDLFDDNSQNLEYRKQGLVNILMPYVQTSLKQAKSFEEMFLYFCDSQKRAEYQLSQKNFMTCVLEKFSKLPIINQSIISYYNKFCQPFSLMYKWIDDKNKIKSKFSLSMFRHYLQSGTAFLISIGDGLCGSSTTLNHLYSTNFPTIKHKIFENDVDIFFNSPQLTVGLNIIDIHGDCTHKKDRMDIILQMAQYYQYWILVQAKNINKLHDIEDYLKQLNINLDQVIFLLKDKTYSQEEVEKGQKQFIKGKFLQISQTQNDKNQGQYGRDLAILKREMKDIIGFGKNVKVKKQNKQESIKNYWDMTKQMDLMQSQYSQIHVNLDSRLEKICKIMMKIIQGIYQENQYFQQSDIDDLREAMNLEKKISKEPYTAKYMEIYQIKKNIKNQVFVNLTIMDEITELQIKKNKLCLKQGAETKSATNIILNKINQFRDIQKGLGVHPIVQLYIDAFCEKKEEELNEFEALVEVISQPVLHPIEIKIEELSKQLQDCQVNLNISEKKYYEMVQNMKQINSDQVENWVKKEAANDQEWSIINQKFQELQKQLISQTKLLENSMMSRDLFQREMIYILQSSEQQYNLQNLNHKGVVKILKDQFLEGKSIEIIDGNNNSINYAVLKDVFDEIAEEVKHQNFQFLPVAILGPQSTGKSTLINMIFGCDFKVSSGRCTKGMDISLKKVFYKNKQYFVLVMDTEGLLIEKADESYDKRLTLLSMACAKKVIVNVNGEINIAMKKILSVALFAGNKLKELSHKPELIFCLRNMIDTDQSKMTEALVAIDKELNEVAKINKVQLQQCLDFKGKDSLVLMRSAFNIETVYSQQDDKTLLYEKITTDQQFMHALDTLKQKIFIDAEHNAKKSLIDWLNGCSSCWEAIQQNFDIFMIDSIKEIEDRNCLGQIIKQIKESSTYQPISQSLCDIRSKYEKQLNQPIQDININEKCRLELQKSYEQYVEAVSNEYMILTQGYQNQDLIQEYKKSLISDIQLLYLKQEQLWHETVISSDNECMIKKKLLLLKKELQDYLFSLKHTDNKNEIQKREKKLNKIFQSKISLLYNQLKSDLEKKQPKIQTICDMIEQSFYSYLKQIKIEDQPYSMNLVKYEAETYYKYSETSLDEQEIRCKQIAQTLLREYFNIIDGIKLYSGLQISKLKEQQIQNINLNKSSYHHQIKINTELLEKQEQQYQKEKEQGTFKKIFNYIFTSKGKNENINQCNIYALAQQQQEQMRINNINSNNQQLTPFQVSQQQNTIEYYKSCLLSFINHQQGELFQEKETQESIIRKMHTMIESIAHYLQQSNFEFTLKFKTDILVSYLFKSFLQYQIQRIKNHQNENIKYFQDKANDLKDKILIMIKEGIDAKKNMNELIDCINNNIANTISFKFKSNVETNLRQESLNIANPGIEIS